MVATGDDRACVETEEGNGVEWSGRTVEEGGSVLSASDRGLSGADGLALGFISTSRKERRFVTRVSRRTDPKVFLV